LGKEFFKKKGAQLRKVPIVFNPKPFLKNKWSNPEKENNNGKTLIKKNFEN